MVIVFAALQTKLNIKSLGELTEEELSLIAILKQEFEDLTREIAYFREILGSEEKLMGVIKDKLRSIKKECKSTKHTKYTYTYNYYKWQTTYKQ